jgi:hypothetical protein
MHVKGQYYPYFRFRNFWMNFKLTCKVMYKRLLASMDDPHILKNNAFNNPNKMNILYEIPIYQRGCNSINTYLEDSLMFLLCPIITINMIISFYHEFDKVQITHIVHKYLFKFTETIYIVIRRNVSHVIEIL